MPSESLYTSEKSDAELLLDIQNSDKYLFHGSQKELDLIEPRQALGDISTKEFNKSKSVYATSSAARAIVSAIMPKGKALEWGTLQDSEGNITIRCNKEVYEKIGSGFVHVLGHKEDAKADSDTLSNQFKYDAPQTPHLIIPVSKIDYEQLGGKFEIIK